MSEDPTENMDVAAWDATREEWIAVPPGAPIADQSWLTAITEGGHGEPAKRDLVLVYKFNTLLDRLHQIDRVKMWGTRKTFAWMIKMLDMQGIELVGIQRQHTPNMQPQMQEHNRVSIPGFERRTNTTVNSRDTTRLILRPTPTRVGVWELEGRDRNDNTLWALELQARSDASEVQRVFFPDLQIQLPVEG